MDAYIYEYYKWLREKTFVTDGGKSDWALISTPFTGAFNDAIEIYVLEKGNKLILSDDGETISNLSLQGINFKESTKLKELLDSIIMKYGVSLTNNKLIIETAIESFPQSKHNILLAIIEVNSLNVLSKTNV